MNVNEAIDIKSLAGVPGPHKHFKLAMKWHPVRRPSVVIHR